MKIVITILFTLVLFSHSVFSQEINPAETNFESGSALTVQTQATREDVSTSVPVEFSVNLDEASTISVYSTTGATVDNFSVQKKEKISFGKDYQKGIYLLRVCNADYASSTLLIKE
jgi:hypothetical protein